jgi:hypothetical protein
MKYSQWRKRKIAKDRKESLRYDDSKKIPVIHSYKITPKFNKKSGFKMTGLGFGGFKMNAGKSFKPSWMNKQEEDSKKASDLFISFMTDAKWDQVYKKFPRCEERDSPDVEKAIEWIIKEMKKKYGNKKISKIEYELQEVIMDTLM